MPFPHDGAAGAAPKEILIASTKMLTGDTLIESLMAQPSPWDLPTSVLEATAAAAAGSASSSTASLAAAGGGMLQGGLGAAALGAGNLT